MAGIKNMISKYKTKQTKTTKRTNKKREKDNRKMK